MISKKISEILNHIYVLLMLRFLNEFRYCFINIGDFLDIKISFVEFNISTSLFIDLSSKCKFLLRKF